MINRHFAEKGVMMSSIQAVSSVSTAYDSAVKRLEAVESGSPSASTDAAAAAQSAAAAKTQSAAGGGTAVAAGASASSSSSSSSSSSTESLKYDKRDTNKDGVVSSEEALAYELKHPNEAKDDKSSASASQKQSALNAYQQNQKSSRILSLYGYSR
jgi:hypothetical protein